MISRRRIEASRKKMPGRRQVRLYTIRVSDEVSETESVPAEWRPVKKSEQRSPDAAGTLIIAEYVFWHTELKGRVIREGDVIEDLEDRTFIAVDSLGVELLGARIRAYCYATVNPILEFDE